MPDDHRIQRLEEQVSTLREQHAAQQQTTAHLSDTVEKLAASVEDLTAALNKGRGVVWLLGAGSAAASSLVTLGGIKLFGGN